MLHLGLVSIRNLCTVGAVPCNPSVELYCADGKPSMYWGCLPIWNQSMSHPCKPHFTLCSTSSLGVCRDAAPCMQISLMEASPKEKNQLPIKLNFLSKHWIASEKRSRPLWWILKAYQPFQNFPTAASCSVSQWHTDFHKSLFPWRKVSEEVTCHSLCSLLSWDSWSSDCLRQIPYVWKLYKELSMGEVLISGCQRWSCDSLNVPLTSVRSGEIVLVEHCDSNLLRLKEDIVLWEKF